MVKVSDAEQDFGQVKRTGYFIVYLTFENVTNKNKCGTKMLQVSAVR